MRVVIAAVQDLFVRGGAELLIDNLQGALRKAGHEVELVRLPFRWSPNEEVLRQAYQWRLMDLRGTGADLVITTKFPSFYVQAERKVAWVLHQHRPLYDCFGLPELSGYSPEQPLDVGLRESVKRWDDAYFREMERTFTISRTVSNRLRHFNGLQAPALYHPPPSAERLVPGPYGDYIFLPTRLEQNKRPWLLVEALAQTRTPVRAVLVGRGGQEQRVRDAARTLGVEGRLDFRGYVSDEERIALYAGARAIFYPPYDEDLGYATLEGFLCQKPVITLADSGEPAELVRSGVNGYVVPGPAEAAAAFDRYYEDEALARAHGLAGEQTYREHVLGWDVICQRLVGA